MTDLIFEDAACEAHGAGVKPVPCSWGLVVSVLVKLLLWGWVLLLTALCRRYGAGWECYCPTVGVGRVVLDDSKCKAPKPTTPPAGSNNAGNKSSTKGP